MTTKSMKSSTEVETFLTTFVEELIAMPDEHVLERSNADEVRAHGRQLFEQAKKDADRRRKPKTTLDLHLLHKLGEFSDYRNNLSLSMLTFQKCNK